MLQGSHILPKTMGDIYVKVEPGSEKFKIKDGSIPTISLENKAENGRANSELKTKLTELFGEKTGIISGHKSRRKKIRCSLPKKEMEQRLAENG